MKPYIYLPGVFAQKYFHIVNHVIQWEQRDAPRAESYYATRPIPYTYGRGAGRRTYMPHVGIPAAFSDITLWLRERFNEEYEMLFCNYYEGPRNHLGWHADDSLGIDHLRGIPVVSFGAERYIYVRENGSKEVDKILLGHGSVLYMRPGMQLSHQHRIPKHSAECGARVSLTFRGYRPTLTTSIIN